MATTTVAEVIVDILVAAGATRVYGVAGDSLNGLTDAIFNRTDIRWIPMRHEEAGHSRLVPRRISLASLPCVPGAAVQDICT